MSNQRGGVCALTPGITSQGIVRAAVLSALAGSCFGASALGATVNSSWAAAVSGTWNTALNWSPAAVPDNGVDDYNVTIGVTGAAYIVDLDIPATINSLDLISVDATLRLNAQTLTTLGGFTIDNNAILVGSAVPSGTLTVGGTTTLGRSVLMNVNNFNANGSLNFDTLVGDVDICDTGIGHGGSACVWTGGNNIQFNGNSSLTLGGSSVFTINSSGNITSPMGGTSSISNSGQILKASAGTTSIAASNIALVNNATATIDVQAGTLSTDGQFSNAGTLRVSAASGVFDVTGAGQFTNFVGGTLSGGTLDLQGTLRFTGADVVNVASKVTLDGASAKIVDETAQDGLRNAAAVNAGGELNIRNGYNLSPAGNFDVLSGGTFDVGLGSTLTVKPATVFTAQAGSTFANIGTTTTGGEIIVRGQVRTSTSSITTVGSKLTLDGAAAAVTDLSNADALGNLATIGATGSFSVLNRPSFVTNAPVFNVNTGGKITVGAGVSFDIPVGTLGNLTSATFDLGQFTLQGRIRTNLPAPGSIPALTLNNTTVLDGVGSSIFDITTNFDLFSRLAVIEADGDLSLLNGRALALTQPLTVRGRLFVGNTDVPRPGAPTPGTRFSDRYDGRDGRGTLTEEVLEVMGDVTQEQGFSSFATGRLRIVGADKAFKVLKGGLGGTGTVEGATWLGGGITGDTAVISPGEQGACNFGTLNLQGSLRLRSGSGFEFDIGTGTPGGSTVADQMFVSLNTTIDAGVVPHIEFRICDDFEPTLGELIPIADLNVASLITFTYGGLSKPNGITITPVWSSGDLYAMVTAVPAPGGAAGLMVLGLAGLRRRR